MKSPGRTAIVRVVGVSAAIFCCSGVAEAWPVRGPVARAERRVIRAQMALERDLGRAIGRGRVIEVPVYPVERGMVPFADGEVPPPAPATAVPAAAAVPQPVVRPLAAGAAAAATPPAGEPQVARATFETRSPQRPAPSTEQAADGTVSVLVHPEAETRGSEAPQERSVEPLLFPGASSQP